MTLKTMDYKKIWLGTKTYFQKVLSASPVQTFEGIHDSWVWMGGLAVLCTFLIFKEISNTKTRLGLGMKPTEVLIFSRALPQGHVLTPNDLKTSLLPQKYLPLGVLFPSDQEKILGTPILRSVGENEALVWTLLEEGAPLSGPSSQITPGYRSIAVDVNATSSVGYRLKAGDHVDMIVQSTLPGEETPSAFTLLQNIKVLDVGTPPENASHDAEGSGGPYSTLTLMVLPKEVPLIYFALKQGEASFALRHPDDYSTQQVPSINHQTLGAAATLNDLQDERDQSFEIIRGMPPQE